MPGKVVKHFGWEELLTESEFRKCKPLYSVSDVFSKGYNDRIERLSEASLDLKEKKTSIFFKTYKFFVGILIRIKHKLIP